MSGEVAARDAYRAVMARRAVAVTVLGVRAQGRDLLVALTDVASASLDPPMLLASLHAESRALEAAAAGEWGLSVVDSSPAATAAVAWLSEPGRPLGVMPPELALTEDPEGRPDGPLHLAAASGWLTCRTAWTRRAGDHTVVAADVVRAWTRSPARGAQLSHLGRVRPWPGQG